MPGRGRLGEDPTDIDTMQQRLRELGYFGSRNWWIEPAFVMDRLRLAFFGVKDRGVRTAREIDRLRNARRKGARPESAAVDPR